jgi:alpha-glucosidase (family GH31 glycosyl hydrolase)
VPHLVNFSVEAMDNSAPVIRPLWMLDPHDPINQVIDDEFLIGDKVNIYDFY